MQVTEGEAVDMLEGVVGSANSGVVTKEYGITALMKLSSRFTVTVP